MLDRSTRSHIERELGQLDRLLTDYRDLLHVESDEPGLVDRTALSSVVQSFYQGVESIFQLIAKRVDEDMPGSADWHRQLLRQMATSTDKRPAVITPVLLDRMESFLGFRHLARHTYPFLLNWSRMRHLVEELGPVFALFRQDVENFITVMSTPEDHN
jgi:hypothetical protein